MAQVGTGVDGAADAKVAAAGEKGLVGKLRQGEIRLAS
jgi:hypothetical protein